MWPTEASDLRTIWSRVRLKKQNGAGYRGHSEELELVVSSHSWGSTIKIIQDNQENETETSMCSERREPP